jgi:hypothetical protein
MIQRQAQSSGRQLGNLAEAGLRLNRVQTPFKLTQVLRDLVRELFLFFLVEMRFVCELLSIKLSLDFRYERSCVRGVRDCHARMDHARKTPASKAHIKKSAKSRSLLSFFLPSTRRSQQTSIVFRHISNLVCTSATVSPSNHLNHPPPFPYPHDP